MKLMGMMTKGMMTMMKVMMMTSHVMCNKNPHLDFIFLLLQFYGVTVMCDEHH